MIKICGPMGPKMIIYIYIFKMIKIGPKLISPIPHGHKRTSISAICMTNGSMFPPSQTLGMVAGIFNTEQPLIRGQ